ncbi:hypothetical protein G3T14_19855 [Methylobacterium sp. BTF04]|uniref:hypothetical protein n=1 Tax=Methylobacterium sp. BTF04 TaxID=2708300 RepID=UPI0013CFA7EF|nr:hypothetical protein [Methylobacterium sp. BTF04]NEU14364.1 hypothetical protein [Methylobacterium sp. BTF04]
MATHAPAIATALLLLLAGAGARAQEASPPAADPAACTGFAWSLLREQAWFSAPGLPRVASGATLPPEMPGAILMLEPAARVDLPFPPSREPKPGTYAGILHLPAPMMPGQYQVTLSERAWIDVSQDGRTPRPAGAHTMQVGCPVIAKSVRFQLGTAPITIVVSGAAGETIKIAVAPAE